MAPTQIVGAVGYGQQNDPGVDILVAHGLERLDPIQALHVQIKQDQIRVMLEREGDAFFTG